MTKNDFLAMCEKGYDQITSPADLTDTSLVLSALCNVVDNMGADNDAAVEACDCLQEIIINHDL